MTILEKFGLGSHPFNGLQGKKLVLWGYILQYGTMDPGRFNVWIGNFPMRTCNFPTEQDIQNLLEHHNSPKTWSFTESIEEAADNADVMYTDVWVHGV